MDVRGGPSDQEVVARVLGGDREAFGLVIRRYETGLVRAYRHLASCRDPSRLRTWLYRIVANRCKSYLARRHVGDVTLEEASPVADSTDNEASLERAEQLALAARALAQLSSEKREAFVLKHVEGLSYQEMAAVTGVRIPTLKMRVHRAREALLRALEDHA